MPSERAATGWLLVPLLLVPLAVSADAADPLEELKNRSPVRRWQDSRVPWTRYRVVGEPVQRPEPPQTERSVPSPDIRSIPVLAPPVLRFSNLPPEPEQPDAEPPAPQPKPQPKPQPQPKPPTGPGLLRKITSIQPFEDYSPSSRLTGQRRPEEVTLGKAPYSGRKFSRNVYQWKATDLFHYPLYFEDPTLERYGHTHHALVQPFVSAGRFAVQLVGLPYQMTIDPIRKKTYTLGWYRPGEVVPYKYYQVPWNTEAALRQASVVTGLFFLIP